MGEPRETSCTFLRRLARDAKANVIALTAAIMIPMIGLVGGAVDVSRLYATKSRLQSACDAGALAGRRTMGAGQWSANSNRANTQAQAVFKLNFPDQSFGTNPGASAAYTESSGTVTGSATADVPMTLMKVFGVSTRTVSVACTSQMVIPNTDVMFVLDTTGSMNCASSDTTATCTNNGGTEKSNAKMKGLRTAVKCFYEALSKVDTNENCTGGAPVGNLSNTVQLRFGFVPYSSNINVGRLLPTSYFADSWQYQSKIPTLATRWTWTAGTVGTPGGWGSWGAAPSTYRTGSNYNSFSDVGGSYTAVTTTDGTSLPRQRTGTSYDTSSECTNNGNPYGSHTTAGYTETSGSPATPVMTTPNTTPDYPETTQTMNFDQDLTRTVNYGYRYRWFKASGASSNGCYLERATPKSAYSTYTVTRTGTATRPLTWASIQEVTGWTYGPRTYTISGLKSGTSWNSAVDLPLTDTSTTVNLSGSTTSSSIDIVANTPIDWSGCIEERQTYKNVDSDPSDEWSPVPSTAYDMDIDMVPDASDTATLWAPALEGAVWGRKDGSGNRTTNNSSSSVNIGLSCPSAAKKLTPYNSTTGWATQTFDQYVDALQAEGSTYHDIGLLWGARLMSPTGIFASENATTPGGAQITRHMVFMTDGDTGTCSTAYSPYGISWWDRRQTNKSNPDDDGGSLCNNTYLNSIVDARTAALCAAIKNMNITLWVVSYGSGVNTTTQTRLSSCASPGRFYSATDTATLIANFQDIANKISALRLTS